MGKGTHFPSSLQRQKSGHKQKSFGNLISLWAHLFYSAKWVNPTSTSPVFSGPLRKKGKLYLQISSSSGSFVGGLKNLGQVHCGAEHSQGQLRGDTRLAVKQGRHLVATPRRRSTNSPSSPFLGPFCKVWFMGHTWGLIRNSESQLLAAYLLNQSMLFQQDSQVTLVDLKIGEALSRALNSLWRRRIHVRTAVPVTAPSVTWER